MNKTPNATVVVSSELKPNDIVITHGMRVLLDDVIHTTRDGVTWSKGKVLNRDEVSGNHVPFTFTAEHTGYPEFKPTGEHRWQIQGNDFARWQVER